jgi:tRNA(Ile)-lysidine synthase
MAGSRNGRSPELIRTVSSVLRRHVLPEQALVLGLSGGVDSAVLLHVLKHVQPQFRFRLSALHVNHGLSPNAQAWEQGCTSLCERLEVPLSVQRVAVKIDSGKGLEAAARAARYRVYAQCEAQWIVAAHQRDDQAETVLLNMLRGAGVRGAAAMPEVRALNPAAPRGPALLRPMLEVPRTAIANYARAQGLDWVEDESNRDTRLARNFLRLEVMPLLGQRFPAAAASLARAAEHFRDAQLLCEALAEIDLRSASPTGRPGIEALAALGELRARNVLRLLLCRAGVLAPDATELREILRQLTHAQSDAQVRAPLGDRVLRRYRGELYFEPLDDPLSTLPVAWNGARELSWGPGRVVFSATRGEGISRARLTPVATRLAQRQGGERFRLDPKRPRRSLKKLLQEAHISPWDRERMPLLWCGEDLVWVPGVGVASEYQCQPDEPGWSVTWLR